MYGDSLLGLIYLIILILCLGGIIYSTAHGLYRLQEKQRRDMIAREFKRQERDYLYSLEAQRKIEAEDHEYWDRTGAYER